MGMRIFHSLIPVPTSFVPVFILGLRSELLSSDGVCKGSPISLWGHCALCNGGHGVEDFDPQGDGAWVS